MELLFVRLVSGDDYEATLIYTLQEARNMACLVSLCITGAPCVGTLIHNTAWRRD